MHHIAPNKIHRHNTILFNHASELNPCDASAPIAGDKPLNLFVRIKDTACNDIALHRFTELGITLLDHDLPLQALALQQLVDQAPATEHGHRVEAAAKGGALVVGVVFKRGMQTKAMVGVFRNLDANGFGEGDFVLKNRL